MFDINYISLLPEIWHTVEDRAKINNMRQTFAIVGLIVAFILPTLFIPDLTNRIYLAEYRLYGIAVAVIIILCGLIFLKFSPKEKAGL